MAVINTNITAMIGQQNLNESKSALTTSMERLSSGLRINSAKDDAAGQAIANRMSSQITGLSQAQRNANDGISVAQTAEGALNQVNDNLQRVRELAVQAENGTNSEKDLTSIQDEINQRLGEIDRISGQTDFNGTKVLAEDKGLSIQVGANDGESISVNLKEINAKTLGLESFNVDGTGEVDNRTATVTDLTAQPTNTDNNDGTYTVTEKFDEVKLDRMLGELNTGDKVSVDGGEDYTFNAESGDFSYTDTSTDYSALAKKHTPPTGGTNSGSFEFSDGSSANFDVNASGELSIDGQAAYISANGELTPNNPDGTGKQATLEGLLEKAGDTSTDSSMSVQIDGVTYSGQAEGTTTSVTSTFDADGFDFGTPTNITSSGLTNFNDSSATINDIDKLATALRESDEIDSATVSGTDIEITYASSVADGATFDFNDGNGDAQTLTATETTTGTGASPAGVSYTETATADEVEAAAASNTGASITTSNGITSASVDFANDGSLANTGAQVYVDNDNALTTTQNVTTDYNVNQETGEVTVKSSDGEGKYAVEEGATAYISSDGRLTTDETSTGERTEDPLAALDSALNQVDSLRSELGAVQNRFESAITNLSTNETNLSAARSRIEDADYATEVANMTKNQILQQAGTSVLAQANQLPQSALSLLG
nr:flagellin [Chromohalobacter japonicus]